MAGGCITIGGCIIVGRVGGPCLYDPPGERDRDRLLRGVLDVERERAGIVIVVGCCEGSTGGT